MIRVLIIDDEPIAITVMKEMLKNYSNLEIVKTYTDPCEALKELKDIKPDVLFLDIEMGDQNGVELAHDFLNVDSTLDIIFVTAYSEYAIEAFEVNAIDYLLKPVIPTRLDNAITRIRKNQDAIKVEKENVQLRIQSFGNFTVFNHDDFPVKWRTAKAKELFAYLWCHQGEALERDMLIEVLFPEREFERANTLFSTTLYQLRKNLSNYLEKDVIQQINRTYIFNEEIQSDYDELKNILTSNEYVYSDFQKIVSFYSNRFMEFEDYPWAFEIQSRIHEHIKIYLLNYLSNLNKEAIMLSHKEKVLLFIYELDRTDDLIIEKIINHYRINNQHIKLKSFYNDYVNYLEKEINIQPSPKIMNLIK